MKATVTNDLVHMFGDTAPLNKGDEIEVEHYAYELFYTIKRPLELSGITIHRDDITFPASTMLGEGIIKS